MNSQNSQNLSPLISEVAETPLKHKLNVTDHADTTETSQSLIGIQAELQPRFGYLSMVAFVSLIGSIQFGYQLVYFGSCINLLTAQLSWSDQQSSLDAAIITGMPAVGLAFGSFGAISITGSLGNRKSILLANLIGIVGVGVSIIENIFAICIGRLIFGFSVGVLQVAGTSFVIETVPGQLMSIFGPLINININTGILIGTFMGLIIPQDSSDPDYMTSQAWRIVFAFPWLLQFLQIVLMMSLVGQESFNLAKAYAQRHDDQDAYYRKVGHVYDTRDTPKEVVDKFMNQLFYDQSQRRPSQESAEEKVTLKAALCSPKYRWATFIAFAMAWMFQFGGVNLIVSYIFPFLEQTKLSLNLGSILYGLAGLLGAIISPFLINWRHMGVRRGFILGFTFVTICFGILAVAVRQKMDAMTLATIMLYQIVMQSTVCPLYWFHIVEIAPGSAILSLSHAWVYVMTLVMTSTGPYVLKTPESDQITFAALALCNLASTIFCYFCVKSSQGLSDEQKRKLYVKGN